MFIDPNMISVLARLLSLSRILKILKILKILLKVDFSGNREGTTGNREGTTGNREGTTNFSKNFQPKVLATTAMTSSHPHLAAYPVACV